MYRKLFYCALGVFLLQSCGGDEPKPDNPKEMEQVVSTATIKVIDYSPAPGQFVNTIPYYEDGDTQEKMNEKAEKLLNSGNVITLGGWGGSVTIKLATSIERVEGKPSFRVLGNAFYSSESTTYPRIGSAEPGVILVMRDSNGNGLPDDGEWYEIAGSETENSKPNYSVTYTKPATEPEEVPFDEYILWKASDGSTGYFDKNIYHEQPYFPQWIASSTLTFKGRRLPDNGSLNEETGYFDLVCYDYGYADCQPNNSDNSLIYLDWAIDSKGNKVKIDKIDFIKIYTGVLQVNGWLGECSTEVSGIQRVDYVYK